MTDKKKKKTTSMAVEFRPATLEEIIGNESTVQTIQSMFDKESQPHAFLFRGPSGCGKTTLALILKDMLGCGDVDYQYLNTSNTRGIDTIRDLDISCRYGPIGGDCRYYLLDECHMLTKEAQNALLALLEIPPDHVYFALCTTDPERLLNTVRSRCIDLQVNPLPRRKIVKVLQTAWDKYWEKEDLQYEYPTKMFDEIQKVSLGSPRNAIRTLEQIISIPDEEAAIKAINDTTVGESDTRILCRLLLDSQPWEVLAGCLKTIVAKDAEQVRYGVLTYLGKVLISRKGGDDKLAEMLGIFTESCMYSGWGGLTYLVYLASKL